MKYKKADDELLARKFNKPIKKVREEMFELSQKQKKEKCLIIFFNKHYIFYNQETIDKFVELYNKDLNEKETLNNLKDYNFTTRDEIKAIKENLLKLGRIIKREVPIKEPHEKQRLS